MTNNGYVKGVVTGLAIAWVIGTYKLYTNLLTENKTLKAENEILTDRLMATDSSSDEAAESIK